MYDLCSISPMLIGQETRVEVAAGTAFANLVSLAAASRAPRDELPTALADALENLWDARLTGKTSR